MTRKIASEMTYNVSSGTLNPTIPTIPYEPIGERILKISPHLPKLSLNIKWAYFYETQCIWWVEGSRKTRRDQVTETRRFRSRNGRHQTATHGLRNADLRRPGGSR